MCVFEKSFKTGLLEVVSIHHGVFKNEIESNTGFKVVYAKNCIITPKPTNRELKILREEVDPLNIRKLEFVSGEDRMKLFKEILQKEKELIRKI